MRRFRSRYIRSLVAGIQFHARQLDPAFPSLFSFHPIKCLLKGIANTFPSAPDARRPITLPILRQLMSRTRDSSLPSPQGPLLECVFALAFYGFLRISEFTTPTWFVPSRDVTLADLEFHPNHYSLSLKHTKTGNPCTIVIARTDSPFCPMAAMRRYVNLRPQTGPSAPLFLTSPHQHMTGAWFTQHLKRTLQRCNLPEGKYSSHSFRIGAATSAAAQGASAASLQQMGRWSSSAFTAYIRPEQAAILAAQRTLLP